MEVLCTNCPELRELCLRRCSLVTDRTLLALAFSCHKLRVLDVNDCTTITDAGVTALSSGCIHLTNLDLNDCCKVTSASVGRIVVCCEDIDFINLGYHVHPSFSDRVIHKLEALRFPSLHIEKSGV